MRHRFTLGSLVLAMQQTAERVADTGGTVLDGGVVQMAVIPLALVALTAVVGALAVRTLHKD